MAWKRSKPHYKNKLANIKWHKDISIQRQLQETPRSDISDLFGSTESQEEIIFNKNSFMASGIEGEEKCRQEEEKRRQGRMGWGILEKTWRWRWEEHEKEEKKKEEGNGTATQKKDEEDGE